MQEEKSDHLVPVDNLRWKVDLGLLPFDTTEDIKPLEKIIGQKRGVEAFRFGMGMSKPGYNIFVTGVPHTGRLSTVKKLLEEISKKKGGVPEDLCYVNNFKNTEAPILIQLKAGLGRVFKKEIHDFVEALKRDVPQLFESQDYLNRKKEIMEEYEKKGKEFFKNLDKKVREQGFSLVDIQVGQVRRPGIMPLIDGNPVDIDEVESMVEKGRYPKDEFEKIKAKYSELKKDIDQIFLELRDMQKGLQENVEKMDHLMFKQMANETASPIRKKFKGEKVSNYLDEMIEDMTNNLQIFTQQPQQAIAGLPFVIAQGDSFLPYEVNLLVDNENQEGPPVIIESYPTYKNLFGSIEKVVDRSGVWKTDFTKIKAGSFIKANGGYLVLNLLDAIMEPGVWQSLKRSLKTEKMEIQTYDPFYLFTTSGLKPEPVEVDIKVAIISDAYLYHLLYFYDDDVKKIFKVRADFDTSMNNNEESMMQFAEFIKMKKDEEELRPFDKKAVAALIEHAVRMTERKEKISIRFPVITDLLREADYWASQDNKTIVEEEHVDRAIKDKIFRSNMVEEHIQEMIDRGTLMIDADGEAVGQVNGLAVYNLGDYMFGMPSRITASTSIGRSGIINIEREADLSGNTHNKGVLILSGYLRKKYAQDKPLTISASIAFEQSYSGVDGDSASSTEIYALLSSISGVPLRQNIAVTGSVNQNGEVQAIGGVNQKIEGFYDCCRKIGFNNHQGVMIPQSNVKDLMLRKDVVRAVEEGKFSIYAVKTIDEGIEIMTGKEAGKIKPDGSYPKGTINYLVSNRLAELAQKLKKFGEEGEKEEKKAAKGKKGGSRKK
jgi:lon-related putative ATP-dependent protease